MYKNILLWLVLGSVLASLFGQFNVADETNEISYSQFIQNVKQGNVSSVKIAGSNISGVTAIGEKFETYSPGDLGLMGDLLNNGVFSSSYASCKRKFYKAATHFTRTNTITNWCHYVHNEGRRWCNGWKK